MMDGLNVRQSLKSKLLRAQELDAVSRYHSNLDNVGP